MPWWLTDLMPIIFLIVMVPLLILRWRLHVLLLSRLLHAAVVSLEPWVAARRRLAAL
jgi:hypothetical protein